MLKTKLIIMVLMSLALVLPAFGKTYKSTYPVPCGDVWAAVKDTLGHPENYSITESDDTRMTASYNVKHSVHASITGTVLQRTNHVTLVPNGSACQMQVVSNFSGFEHNDRDDFRKRVDEALAKPKSATPSPAAKPQATAK